MNNSILDVVVIGAGHAGLSMSYHLKKTGLTHMVLECDRIGNSWRSQRWDTFKLNSPNRFNNLPGMDNILPDQDGFCYAHEFVSFLEHYAVTYELPVVEHCRVTAVDSQHENSYFRISATHNGSEKTWLSRQVVVASGGQNQKKIPSFSTKIDPGIFQIHSGEYRNHSLLPDGSVLIAGTAQSGTQIAEDLIESGRKVFLSTSKVARLPRRYRGKDILDWLIIIGFYDVRMEEVTDPELLKLKPPVVSGVGLRGKTLSLQALAKQGAIILGSIDNAVGSMVFFQPNAAEHVKFADASSKKAKDMIDDYINKSGLPYPPPEIDEADIPDSNTSCACTDLSLNLRENNIATIIWTTGFSGDFSYLKLPVFDAEGTLIHNNGITEINGLYILGLPWLRKRKSGIIWGIIEDVEFIMEKILFNCKSVSV